MQEIVIEVWPLLLLEKRTEAGLPFCTTCFRGVAPCRLFWTAFASQTHLLTRWTRSCGQLNRTLVRNPSTSCQVSQTHLRPLPTLSSLRVLSSAASTWLSSFWISFSPCRSPSSSYTLVPLKTSHLHLGILAPISQRLSEQGRQVTEVQKTKIQLGYCLLMEQKQKCCCCGWLNS